MAKRKENLRVTPREAADALVPNEAGAMRPDEIVAAALFPAPEPETYMEFKAITLRPVAEIVAILDGCAKELGMSRNSLAVTLLSGAVRECLQALPEEHRKRACETAAEILGIEIEWEQPEKGAL